MIMWQSGTNSTSWKSSRSLLPTRCRFAILINQDVESLLLIIIGQSAVQQSHHWFLCRNMSMRPAWNMAHVCKQAFTHKAGIHAKAILNSEIAACRFFEIGLTEYRPEHLRDHQSSWFWHEPLCPFRVSTHWLERDQIGRLPSIPSRYAPQFWFAIIYTASRAASIEYDGCSI